jgi:hypothetical protein
MSSSSNYDRHCMGFHRHCMGFPGMSDVRLGILPTSLLRLLHGTLCTEA